MEVSLDGINWATAQDNSGTDISGTLVVNVATIDAVYMPRRMKTRISLTVTSQTGSVSYYIKPGDSDN